VFALLRCIFRAGYIFQKLNSYMDPLIEHGFLESVNRVFSIVTVVTTALTRLFSLLQGWSLSRNIPNNIDQLIDAALSRFQHVVSNTRRTLRLFETYEHPRGNALVSMVQSSAGVSFIDSALAYLQSVDSLRVNMATIRYNDTSMVVTGTRVVSPQIFYVQSLLDIMLVSRSHLLVLLRTFVESYHNFISTFRPRTPRSTKRPRESD